MNLSGKSALITGASRGIGRAIALRLAQAGANVALLARSTDALREVADEAESHGVKAVTLSCDVTSAAAVDSAVVQAIATFGDLDILVNNACSSGAPTPSSTSPRTTGSTFSPSTSSR